MPAAITHISYYLPEHVFTNAAFFELFPALKTNENLKKIGVEQRVISAQGQTASDMAVEAAKKLMLQNAIEPNSIDFLLYSSLDFDYKFPATANVIHQKLGLAPTCGTLDVSHGCSAYVYALSVAKGLILANEQKRILVLSANTLTKDLHPKDKAARFVFGDAAAATLVEHVETNGIQKCIFGTDSNGIEKIILHDGGARNPVNNDSFTEIADEYGNVTSKGHFFMDGTSVFLFSIKRVPQLIQQVLEANNAKLDDIDLFLFHQANLYMIDTIVKKVGIDPQKVFNNMHKIGNTVGASIPIALAQAFEEGKAEKGQKAMLIGFGVGLSLSGTIIKL